MQRRFKSRDERDFLRARLLAGCHCILGWLRLRGNPPAQVDAQQEEFLERAQDDVQFRASWAAGAAWEMLHWKLNDGDVHPLELGQEFGADGGSL